METRAIMFRKLKEICGEMYCACPDNKMKYYCYKTNKDEYMPCTAANCPVWRKLKVIK
jgi:hypothetical protein